MMPKGHLVIAVFLLVLIPHLALGETPAPADYIETFAFGEINWKTGRIKAVGCSEPFHGKKILGKKSLREEALSAARKNAGDALADLIGRLRLAGGRTVSDAMAAEPVIAEKIGEMARSVPVVRQTLLPDGVVKIDVEMNLRGGFSQLVLPGAIRHFEAIQSVHAAADKQDTRPPGQAGGLVIDARGLGAVPAMMFTVLDENGKPVYGSAYVSREYAVQWGMAAYVRRVPEGDDFKRVAPRPLVIKGLRAVGVGRTDIVISNADAIKLKGTVEHLLFLKKGRVAVVLD